MERRKFSNGGESMCEQVCLQLLLKEGDVVYFPEVFLGIEFQGLGAVRKTPVPVAS